MPAITLKLRFSPNSWKGYFTILTIFFQGPGKAIDCLGDIDLPGKLIFSKVLVKLVKVLRRLLYYLNESWEASRLSATILYLNP